MSKHNLAYQFVGYEVFTLNYINRIAVRRNGNNRFIINVNFNLP